MSGKSHQQSASNISSGKEKIECGKKKEKGKGKPAVKKVHGGHL
jgi:hypothetical protein